MSASSTKTPKKVKSKADIPGSAKPSDKDLENGGASKNDPDSTKPKPTWKSKLVGFLGQSCCWTPNVACCEKCRNLWRAWLAIVAILTMFLSVFGFLVVVRFYVPYSDSPTIFIGDKMKKLFLLSDNMSPIWLLSTVVSTFFVSIWSLIFALQPEKGRHSALIVYKCISSIVVLSVLILTVVQVVLFVIESPNDKYRSELHRVMRNDMEFGRPPDLIRKSWVDTQDVFQCCGIYSKDDWFKWAPTKNKSYRKFSRRHSKENEKEDRELPLSCCDDQVEYCFESQAWKDGCLETQISTVISYSWFCIIFIYILYFLMDWLCQSVGKFFMKFPATEADEKAKDLLQTLNTASEPNSKPSETKPAADLANKYPNTTVIRIQSRKVEQKGSENTASVYQKHSSPSTAAVVPVYSRTYQPLALVGTTTEDEGVTTGIETSDGGEDGDDQTSTILPPRRMSRSSHDE